MNVVVEVGPLVLGFIHLEVQDFLSFAPGQTSLPVVTSMAYQAAGAVPMGTSITSMIEAISLLGI